jgi:hypothetical protein
MKLLYIGSHFCPAHSLARLLLLGNELCFLDRPSVTFGNWGTIGHDSYMRQISFGTSPVKISVHKPPSGPAHELYQPYIQADITNPDFVGRVFRGLETDDAFAARLLPPQANYGDGVTGADLRRSLTGDQSLASASLDLSDPSKMYEPKTAEGRKQIFRSLVVDASIEITSALVMADEIDALPVGDDATYPRLLALRTSGARYVGGTPSLAPALGLQFARSVIPDEVLRQIEFSNIFDYRNKTKGLYDAWNVELNKAAAKISEAELTNPIETIQKIIVTDLAPQLSGYESEMAAIRDDLFGSLVKSVVKWELPTLAISHVADLGYAGALAAFGAGVQATVPHIVDFVRARRVAARKHAVSYLVGLTQR